MINQFNESLQQLIFADVGRQIMQHGFKPRIADQLFYKAISNKRFAIHLSFINHETDFDLTLDVAIRFNDLEKMVNETEPFLSQYLKNKTYSLGAELGNISEGKQKRWTFGNTNDVQSNIVLLMQSISDIGLPYLVKYSDMQEAFNVLNDPSTGWLHSPIDLARSKRILGLTFLLKRYDLFLEIASSKIELLKSKHNTELNSFISFKEFLENKWN